MSSRGRFARGRRLGLVALILGASLGIAGEADACNACLEDKVAATYDWQVVSAAQRSGHTVVFTALRGRIAPNDRELSRFVSRSIEGIPGSDHGTVRVSLTPPAVSFACDSKRYPPSKLIAAMNRALRTKGVTLELIRVGVGAGAGNRT